MNILRLLALILILSLNGCESNSSPKIEVTLAEEIDTSKLVSLLENEGVFFKLKEGRGIIILEKDGDIFRALAHQSFKGEEVIPFKVRIPKYIGDLRNEFKENGLLFDSQEHKDEITYIFKSEQEYLKADKLINRAYSHYYNNQKNN